MPLRKGESSEASHESRRTSLRRLSSIASIQALNPFTKRRSNNATDSTVGSSTSNLSLSSTINSPQQQQQGLQHSSSRSFPSDEDIAARPIPPVSSQLQPRRSSYICLPDDPIGGMPRSRTFSNLPLPTRARRNPIMVSSKTHIRLPSTYLPSTRLPSPAMSNRKYSTSKLSSATKSKSPLIRNRMKRSDTEPLPPFNPDQTNIGRTTAFKENITLSPIEPLPRLLMHGQAHASRAPSHSFTAPRGWVNRSDGTESWLNSDASEQAYTSSTPFMPHAEKNSHSSPAYRAFRERASTPGNAVPQPVQRWNSQPVVTNITNRLSSHRVEIQERRLMSGVQPEFAPPPPKTPLSAEALTTGRLRSSTASSRLRDITARNPPVTRSAKPSQPAAPPGSSQQVFTREPVAYWCGRFSALTNRYRNEELSLAHSQPSSHKRTASTPLTTVDDMHSPEASTRRMRRALEQLRSLCTTAEARESFVVFQVQLAALQNNPELGRPIVLNVPERKVVLGKTSEVTDGCEVDIEGGVGEVRKATFVERLLGKTRRSLIS